MVTHTHLSTLAALLLSLGIALCGLGCSDPGDSRADQTDLVLENAGSVGIESLRINGVDQGSLSPGEVLTIEDVGSEVFLIQAYRSKGDQAPCATWEATELSPGEPAHHVFDCR